MGDKTLREEKERRIEELERELAELKREKEYLCRHARRYVSLFNNNHAVMLLIDPNTAEIVDANPAACLFYGCPREQLREMKITDINTLPKDEVFRSMKRGIAEGKLRFIFRHRLTDGNIRDVEVYSGPIEEAGRLLLLSIIHDVTDRKRAEEALARSETMFRALAESTQFAIFIIQGDSVVYANPACEKMGGYTCEEISSRPYWLFFHPAMKSRVGKPIDWSHGPWKRPVRDEVKFVTKTGETRWLQYAATRIAYNGAPALLGTAVDVTQRREAQERLRQAYEDLEHRVQERTVELVRTNDRLLREINERRWAEEALERSERELRYLSAKLLSAQEKERKRIAGELHDGISQTLALIRIMLGNTQEQVQTDASVHKSLETVRDIASQALDDLRTIIAGLRPPILDHLGILATISSLCREFQDTYKTIRVREVVTLQEQDIPENLKVVIYRVVQEALNNVATHSKASRVTVSLQLMGDHIHLEIRDNGQGFDLWDALSREGMPKGLGIGSMKERVEFSGGCFLLQPEKGSGTTISASWPHIPVEYSHQQTA